MNGESRFPAESFKLLIFGFYEAEIRDEPGGRPSEENRDLTGESELRMLVRPLLYGETSSSRVKEESRVRVENLEERKSMLMSFILWNEIYIFFLKFTFSFGEL